MALIAHRLLQQAVDPILGLLTQPRNQSAPAIFLGEDIFQNLVGPLKIGLVPQLPQRGHDPRVSRVVRERLPQRARPAMG